MRNSTLFSAQSGITALLATLLPAVIVLPAQAQSYTWTGNGATGNWSQPANWGGTDITGGADSLTFTGASNLNSINDLGSYRASSITFDSNASSFQLSGGALTDLSSIQVATTAPVTIANNLTLSNTGATVTLSASNSLLTLSGNVTGASPDSTLTVAGAGTLSLAGTVTTRFVNNGNAKVLAGNTATINGSTFTNAGNFQLDGTNNSAGVRTTLNVDGSTVHTQASKYLSVGSNSTLNLNNVTLTGEGNNGGVYLNSSSAQVNFSGSSTLGKAGRVIGTSGSTINVAGPGTVVTLAGVGDGVAANRAALSETGGPTVQVDNGAVIRLSGDTNTNTASQANILGGVHFGSTGAAGSILFDGTRAGGTTYRGSLGGRVGNIGGSYNGGTEQRVFNGSLYLDYAPGGNETVVDATTLLASADVRYGNTLTINSSFFQTGSSGVHLYGTDSSHVSVLNMNGTTFNSTGTWAIQLFAHTRVNMNNVTLTGTGETAFLVYDPGSAGSDIAVKFSGTNVFSKGGNLSLGYGRIYADGPNTTVTLAGKASSSSSDWATLTNGMFQLRNGAQLYLSGDTNTGTATQRNALGGVGFSETSNGPSDLRLDDSIAGGTTFVNTWEISGAIGNLGGSYTGGSDTRTIINGALINFNSYRANTAYLDAKEFINNKGNDDFNGKVNVWENNTLVLLTPSITNNGTITVRGGTLQVNDSRTIAGTGDIAITKTNFSTGGTIHTEGANTVLRVAQAVTGTGDLTKTGAGTLTLTKASTYNATTVKAGTLLLESGATTGTGALTVEAGGTLAGTGTVKGNATISGTLAPGASPGTLTFNNNLSLLSSSVFNMEIAGLTPGSWDSLVIGKDLTLGGTLNISFLNGFMPTDGDSFVFASWGGIQTGSFSNVSFGSTLPSNIGYSIVNVTPKSAAIRFNAISSSVVPESGTIWLYSLGALLSIGIVLVRRQTA